MDKDLDPITAVEESWRMTRGYGWTIFWMAFLSFFIFIAGLCVLFVEYYRLRLGGQFICHAVQ